MRRARRVAAAGVAVAFVVGCASEAPGRDELAEALVQSGLTEEVASCTADALVDNLSDAELADLALRGSGAAPVDDPDREDDSADALRLALDACRALQAEVAPTTTTTTAAPTPPPSTTVPTTQGAELRPAPSEGSSAGD